MNYKIILDHIVSEQIGKWPESNEAGTYYSLFVSDGVYELVGWNFPSNKPDISTFTAQDEVDAAAAWAAYQQTSKSADLKVRENLYLQLCDSIRGTPTHEPYTPHQIYTYYESKIGGAQETAATRNCIKGLLALINVATDVSNIKWHADV